VQLIRRPVATLALALITPLVACVGSTAGAGTGGSAPTPRGQHVEVTLTDFKIEPAQVVVQQDAIVFDVANRGQTPHNLSLRDDSGRIVGHTRDLAPGQSATLVLQLAAGTYTSFCSLAGHESLGMRGTVANGG
jgi:plastocyanin